MIYEPYRKAHFFSLENQATFNHAALARPNQVTKSHIQSNQHAFTTLSLCTQLHITQVYRLYGKQHMLQTHMYTHTDNGGRGELTHYPLEITIMSVKII